MKKLRNIGYLQFGSKIRQSFAGGITSLTTPLSLSTLWISWAENEGAREGAEFYIWGGSLPAGPLPPHHLAAGGLLPGRGAAGTRQGPLCKKNYFYLHIAPTAPCRTVGV